MLRLRQYLRLSGVGVIIILAMLLFTHKIPDKQQLATVSRRIANPDVLTDGTINIATTIHQDTSRRNSLRISKKVANIVHPKPSKAVSSKLSLDVTTNVLPNGSTADPTKARPKISTSTSSTLRSKVMFTARTSRPKLPTSNSGTSRPMVSTSNSRTSRPMVSTSNSRTSRPRILCWILTRPAMYKTKAKAVKETWGRRCDKLLFVSSQSNNTYGLPVLAHPNITVESRKTLTNKTIYAFTYIYENHFKDYDWFFKADDDTYAFLENLRAKLRGYDPEKLYYYGHQMGPRTFEESWFSGGGGYVLSKGLLRLFMNRGRHNETLCPWYIAEDYYLGRCFERMKVPHDHRLHELFSWYGAETTCKLKGYKGRKEHISFHYVKPKDMYTYEFPKKNVTSSCP